MKRCLLCSRVYSDESLNYCLDDGSHLVEDPRIHEDKPTTPLSEEAPGEAPTEYLRQTNESEGISRRRRVSRSITSIEKRRIWLFVLIASVLGFAGLFVYKNYYASANKQIESIAVMPFENVNGSPDTDYLSDGISEALINSLTELPQLKVTARSTAFRYKGKEIEPAAVGKELNVGAVLMGRVRQVGDSLDVQVDLIDANSGVQLWGQEYERKMTDVVNIKQSIAREVTEKLRLRLSGEQEQRLTHRDTSDPEAFQFYLRGRYYWNKRTADNLRKAIDQFQQAIDRDPNYALGYVGLADSYLLLEIWADVPGNDALTKAKDAIDRALELDDSLAEAHASLGQINMHMWHWNEAESEYKRAITLNPNYPTVHLWFCLYFRIKRQFDDALRECRRAQELDPVLPTISRQVAHVYLLTNNFNAAIQECNRVIEIDPSFPPTHTILGFAYLRLGRNDDAIAEFEKAVELSGRTSESLSELGYGYAMSGKRFEALRILKELEERYARGEAIGQYLAAVYAGLGDRDHAFALLQKDFEEHSSLLPYITYAEVFENLHGDPRFAELVHGMGL